VLDRLAGDDHEAAVGAAPQQRLERQRDVLEGADQQVVQGVPVVEAGLGERRRAAPAADQVHHPVDDAVLAFDACRQLLDGGAVEQVDVVPADADDGVAIFLEISRNSLTCRASCPGYQNDHARSPSVDSTTSVSLRRRAS
jgi:hypothetical protein